jgi:hypothetical protein
LGWSKNCFTPKKPMKNLPKHAGICVSLSQKSSQCCKQWGSCTLLDRGWIAWECQLACADQDQDWSIGLQCHIARHGVSTHTPNKTSEDCHIFGVKQKSCHPQKIRWKIYNLQEFVSPRHRKAINAVKNGDSSHSSIEGGQFKNANWFMLTKIGIDRLVYNAIQLIMRCLPMPQTKHQKNTPHERSPPLWGEAKITSPRKTWWIICKNLKEFVSPCHRETINVVNKGDHAHFRIQDGQLRNAN